MARPTARDWAARFAAPAAFLLAVTIAVLLVRSALNSDDGGRTQTTAPTTTAATTRATTTRAARARAPARRFYRIQSGDTFGTVAEKFDTTVEALQALNPGVESNSLTIGQRIRVR